MFSIQDLPPACTSILSNSRNAELVSYTEVKSLLGEYLPYRGTETFVNDMCNAYPKFEQGLEKECPKNQVLVIEQTRMGDIVKKVDITYDSLMNLTSHFPQRFCSDPCYIDVAKKVDADEKKVVCSPCFKTIWNEIEDEKEKNLKTGLHTLAGFKEFETQVNSKMATCVDKESTNGQDRSSVRKTEFLLVVLVFSCFLL